jgi:class 3 adenylate cyclase
VLRTDGQTIVLLNAWSDELVVRVERTAPRADALTAARAATLALFRELFPGEVLAPGQLVSVATVCLLATELDDTARLYQERGDAKAFASIHEHFRRVETCVRREGGAMVKVSQAGVIAGFPDPASAVKAALALFPALAESDLTRGLLLRAGVHRGPALTATLNDHLDYFGATVNLALDLPRHAEPGRVALGGPVASDPGVVKLLRYRGLEARAVPVTGPGGEAEVAHVVGPAAHANSTPGSPATTSPMR